MDSDTGTRYKDDYGVTNDTSHHYPMGDSSNPFDTGATPMFPKGYMQSFVGKEGNLINYDMSRLNVRYIPHKQKAFYHVSQTLKTGCERLSTTFCLNTAKKIWATIARTGVVKRGSNRKGLIGNCLLYATHMHKYPRSQDDVAEALYIKSSDITKAYKYFRQLLSGTENEHVLGCLTSHQSRFTKFIRLLNIDFQYGLKCEAIFLKYQDQLDIVAPNSAIAGIIYWIVLKHNVKNVTKQDIKKHIGVCIPTLNKVVAVIDKLEI